MANERSLIQRLLGFFLSRGEKVPAEGQFPSKVDCIQVREMASDYVEEDLPGGMLATIRRHLDECKHCTAFINTFRGTIEMMRDMPIAKASDKVRQSINDAISRR